MKTRPGAGRRQGDRAAIRPAARRRVRRPPVPQVARRALAGWSPWQSWPFPRASRAVAAAGHVLAWLASLRRRVPRIGGLARARASVEGNALAACCRLGLAADPRVRSLAGSLIAWQWPDGGWNCDPAATGRRSSFHESLAPAWGLHEYGQATGDPAARDAASRTAGLFLAHRIGRCFSGAPGPTPPRCGTGPRASRARRARWSARPRVLSPFR
jgi:hypothetical protein